MSKKLITWRVSDPVPSFHVRGWPLACFTGTDNVAARIECDLGYSKERADSGKHEPLTVYVARWFALPNATPVRCTFEWRKLTKKCATLAEAKAAAERVLASRIASEGWLPGPPPEKTQMEKDEIRKRAIVLALITDAGLREKRPAWAALDVDALMDVVETVLHLDARYEEDC